jgi:hypothetical protein
LTDFFIPVPTAQAAVSVHAKALDPRLKNKQQGND